MQLINATKLFTHQQLSNHYSEFQIQIPKQYNKMLWSTVIQIRRLSVSDMHRYIDTDTGTTSTCQCLYPCLNNYFKHLTSNSIAQENNLYEQIDAPAPNSKIQHTNSTMQHFNHFTTRMHTFSTLNSNNTTNSNTNTDTHFPHSNQQIPNQKQKGAKNKMQNLRETNWDLREKLRREIEEDRVGLNR
jgi:hypothetical protein